MADEGAPKKKNKFTGQIFMVFGVLAGIVFLPTTILLVVGMLPTPMAILVDKKKKMAKIITVGALNLAGCTFFLVELWGYGNNFEKSIEILLDPLTIMTIYGFAGFGYLVNSFVTGVVASGMQARAQIRKKDIIKRQEELIERWGEKVTGRLKLGADGFPLGDKPKKEQEDFEK